MNSRRGDPRRHNILWWYHVNKYRAMRGNRSELAPGRKSPRCHVNTPLVLGRKVNHATTSACIVFARISFFLNVILYAIFPRISTRVDSFCSHNQLRTGLLNQLCYPRFHEQWLFKGITLLCHLETVSLNFSSSSFVLLVNLRHPFTTF